MFDETAHRPWPPQPAEAGISMNTLALAQGIRLPNLSPMLHYARRLDVALWLGYRIDDDTFTIF